jgi:sarcosine oxidase
VKAALHHAEDPVDPNTGAGEATPAEVQQMREILATRLPRISTSEWVGGKPCLYTLTPDEHFVLGRHPRYERVAVAGGFSGHGFKFAPVVGEILADLALTGTTRHVIDLFAPDRFADARASA